MISLTLKGANKHLVTNIDKENFDKIIKKWGYANISDTV